MFTKFKIVIERGKKVMERELNRAVISIIWLYVIIYQFIKISVNIL